MAPLRGEARAGSGLGRETCIEISARMQCSPRPSVNILEPLVASFYGAAEQSLGRVPTREEVAGLMNVTAVARWFEDTHGIDRNGLTTEHAEYLKLLRTRGASAEEEIRRALGILEPRGLRDRVGVSDPSRPDPRRSRRTEPHLRGQALSLRVLAA